MPGSVPAAPAHHRGGNILMLFSVILLLISLGFAGGAYARVNILSSSQNTYKNNLATLEKEFDVNTIQQLKGVNIQIDTAKKLLAAHLAPSQIFEIISHFTSSDVRFLSLTLTGPTASNGNISISMNGSGTSLYAVAFQSDVLGNLQQYGLRNIVENPIISSPTLNSNNTVSFGFTASLNPSALSYENSVTNGGVFSASAATTNGTTTATTSQPTQSN